MTDDAKHTGAWDITLEDCTVGYGDTVVLSDLNLTMPAGEITVILGGSGGGKSTLLRHILGLNRPMEGRILLGGHDLFAMPTRSFRRARRSMGVLFQDGALLGSLTLGDNVGLPLKEHTSLNASERAQVVRHKLSLVGLDGYESYFPNQLSGGMRKRAGLARAIVMDPPVLFCDEPTSGLDPINSAQMDQLLRDMNTRLGVTVVVVSHDLASMNAVADHVVVLHDGTSVFHGPATELARTEDPYLRRFLDRLPDEDEDGEQVPEPGEKLRAAIRRGLEL